jgi:hypothetical protein
MSKWFGPAARQPRTVVNVSWENEVYSGGATSSGERAAQEVLAYIDSCN